jgi:hypothetical protein
MSIIKLYERSGSAKHISPREVLEEAMKGIDSDDVAEDGAFVDCKKILVIALDDRHERYNISFMQAGLSNSAAFTLATLTGELFKGRMGLLESDYE